MSQPQAAVAAHQPPTPQQQATRLLAWITPLGLLSSLVWGAIGASQILGRVASRRGIVGLGILPDSALAQDYIIGIGAANLLAAIGQTIPLVATALRKWRAVEPLRRIFRNGFLWVGGYGLASAIIYEDITFLAIAIPLAALEGALWLLVDRLVYIADRLQQDTGQHQQRDTPEVHVGIVEPEFVTYAASPGSPASSSFTTIRDDPSGFIYHRFGDLMFFFSPQVDSDLLTWLREQRRPGFQPVLVVDEAPEVQMHRAQEDALSLYDLGSLTKSLATNTEHPFEAFMGAQFGLKFQDIRT